MKKFYPGLICILFTVNAFALTLNENFEAAGFTKNTYDINPAGNGSEDNVTFSSGTWRVFDAIRGNTAGSDRFNGNQSVRARSNTAVIEMQFNKTAGAGTVSVYAAKYGSDANSTFRFEASTDGGATWPYASSTFTVSTTTLTQFSWTANLTGGVRVRMVKLSSTSTSNRLNFDDFSVTDYTTGSSEINLQQPAGTNQVCGFTYDYGTLSIGSAADLTVRVENLGSGDMGIGTVTLSGANASEFSVQTMPSATTAPAAFSDMVVRFTALQAGSKSVTLTITSDDTDENPCTIQLIANAVYVPCSELYISEYGEPASGNGKYIEIYNPTNAPVDLSNYRIWLVSNGGTWPESSYSLSGTLAAKDAYVVAYDNTVTGYDVINTVVCNFNGNDAVGLAKNIAGTFYLIDAVGADGADPGAGWQVAGQSNATRDKTLVRKSSVTIPNTDWTSSAGTNATNSEWFVRPYSLGNVACHISACSVLPTVSFSTTNSVVNESSVTVSVDVTLDIAPAADLTVNIYDALLGTATPGSDYTFTTTPLTFPVSGSYPLTQSVSVTIINDAVSESNENIVLSIDAQCGALTGTGTHTITILDNEIPEGLVINELSQGSASKEYVELVVAGTPGTTVDLRGWIIDDNSGIFSGGYGTQMGIAPGHLKFSDHCTWEKVPVGSVILLYNATDKNASIALADDPTDADLDYTYVIGIESAASCATMPTSNLYFASDCVNPNNSSYDTYLPPVYVNADWNTMQLRNSGDAVQVRSPSGGFYHGISYGTKGGTSDCGTCEISSANHPDHPIYGAQSLYFSGTSNVTYAFLNTTDDDFRSLSNWSSTTLASPNALESPGTFNGAANQAWILSLRAPFGVVTDDQSYTCNLRAYESRLYLDGNDRIIYFIRNNGATDHGSFTAQTVLHDDATPGLGFQNASLSGTPLFMQKTFVATPTVSGPADYAVRFYMSNQELQDFCDYVNPIIDATLSTTGTNFTPASIIPFLKIYRTSGTDRAWSVTSDAQTEIVMPLTGTYGVYYTFEQDPFNAFSGYALGVTITEIASTILPVELTRFTASCENDAITVRWETASEFNASHFDVERSYDALHFNRIGSVSASGYSVQLRQYLFVDDNFIRQIPVYYRLKQVDRNGTATYSGIVTQACGSALSLVTVYPNPARDVLIISLTGSAKQYQRFQLYDVTGRLLKRVIVRNPELVEIDVSDLADGVYILEAEHPGGWSFRQKIIKD